MRPLSAIELDLNALQHNWLAFKPFFPNGSRTCAVVKANAYGHGLKPIVEAMEGLPDMFAVDDVEELAELRKVTETQALVLGFIPKDAVAEALRLGCEFAVFDVDRLPDIQSAAEGLGLKARLHLKIDALLGRQGVLPNQVGGFLSEVRKHPNIEIVAAYSHFGNIEDTTDLTHAHRQTEAFEAGLDSAAKAGFQNLMRHESATSGLLATESPESPNRLARLGIGLYGLYPSQALERSFRQLSLEPVMRWVTRLAQVKDVPAKHPIGYGLTYLAPRAMRIGIVPQGYSDGYDRGLSNCGEVLVGGNRCAVLGRVAMNMFAVDLTESKDAEPEDEVVLLGAQGTERISAEEIAQRTGTINYEVVARVSPLLPRIACR